MRKALLFSILCVSFQASAQDQVIIPITGQQTMSGSTPVVIASDQSDLPVTGTLTCNIGTSGSLALNSSVDGIESSLTTLNAKDFATQTTLAAIEAKVPALGQALAAGSVPVVLTAAQLSTLTPPAAITGFATLTEQQVQSNDLEDIRIQTLAIDADATTIIGHVDGIENLIGTTNTTLGTIDTDTGNIDTSLNNIESATGIPTTVSDTSQNVTTAGTRVQLSSATCKKIIITAKAANTGTIWVGGSTVASGRGIPLVALQNVTLDIANANAIYIDSTQNGEGVTYALLN